MFHILFSSNQQVGINHQQPSFVPGGDLAQTTKAVCMLANSTAIVEGFSRMNMSKWSRTMKKYFNQTFCVRV